MIDGTLPGLLQDVVFTLRDPRGAARRLIGLNLPMQVRWLGLALAAVASTLLTILAVRASPAGTDPMVQQFLANPLMLAAIQAFVLLTAAQMMARVGHMAGGRGSFADALVLLVWLQIILILVQVAQLALELVAPLFAELLGLGAVGLLFWLLTHFVAELHGFKSLGAVFAGILGSTLALSFAMALLLLTFVGG